MERFVFFSVWKSPSSKPPEGRRIGRPTHPLSLAALRNIRGMRFGAGPQSFFWPSGPREGGEGGATSALFFIACEFRAPANLGRGGSGLAGPG